MAAGWKNCGQTFPMPWHPHSSLRAGIVHIHGSRNRCLLLLLNLFPPAELPVPVSEVEIEQGCSLSPALCHGHPHHASTSPITAGAWHLPRAQLSSSPLNLSSVKQHSHQPKQVHAHGKRHWWEAARLQSRNSTFPQALVSPFLCGPERCSPPPLFLIISSGKL